MTMGTAAPAADRSRRATLSESTGSLIERARRAQSEWARRPIRQRISIIGEARRVMVDRAQALAGTVGHAHRRHDAETLAAEVMPLIEAARYLERRAGRVLRARTRRAGRPMTGRDLGVRVTREPWGVVLIIGPSNYPLMLPGVQALQALAAGNAVALKPGREGSVAAEALRGALVDAGLPAGLFAVLEETNEAGPAAIQAGVDHVVMTGSEASGRAVARAAAETLTPMTGELGGHDAMIVLDGADLELVTRAVVFGLTANQGATCIAPRRLFATPAVARQLAERLAAALPTDDPAPLPAEQSARLDDAIDDALRRGARVIAPSTTGEPTEPRRSPSGRLDVEDEAHAGHGAGDVVAPPGGSPPPTGGDRRSHMPPTLLADVTPESRIMHEDLFAPLLAICPVESIEEAVVHVNGCAYGLGASVFGPAGAARGVAKQLDVGVAMINDLIAPVGDPRLPLAGRGLSGFGVTRGEEGLLAMTRPKATAARRGKWRPHYDPPTPKTAALIRGYLDLAHGRSFKQRLAGLRKLIRSIRGAS